MQILHKFAISVCPLCKVEDGVGARQLNCGYPVRIIKNEWIATVHDVWSC